MSRLEIENHMLSNIAEAPWNRPDDSRQHESCLICNSTMILDNEMGWMNEYDRYLSEAAGECPGGYVCGAACRSQAMYNALGAKEQAALRTILSHTHELKEALKTLGVLKAWQFKETTLLRPFVDDLPFTSLFDGLHQCESLLLGDQNENGPAWTEGLA